MNLRVAIATTVALLCAAVHVAEAEAQQVRIAADGPMAAVISDAFSAEDGIIAQASPRILPEGYLANRGRTPVQIVIWLVGDDGREPGRNPGWTLRGDLPRNAAIVAAGEVRPGDRIDVGRLEIVGEKGIVGEYGYGRLVIGARSAEPVALTGELRPPRALEFPGDSFFPSDIFFPTDVFFPSDIFFPTDVF